MTYLHPPPGDAPVIVTKDVGGYVDQYAAMTRLYAETGREVRLHECRSACTLALSLPNVCVYPDALLKFHKAYNPLTRVANDEVSDAMMAAYPAAVRERLGDLTRSYKVLTGSELIRLGVRDCNRPAGPVYAVARAKTKPAPSEPGFLGRVAEAFSPAAAPEGIQAAPQRVQTAAVREPPPQPDAPLPPSRPAALEPRASNVASRQAGPQVAIPAPPALEDSPSPPPRPNGLEALAPVVAQREGALAPETPPPAAPRIAIPAPAPAIASGWGRKIAGSAPILAATGFARVIYRVVVRKG